MMKQELKLRVQVTEDVLSLGAPGGVATEVTGEVPNRYGCLWMATGRNKTSRNAADLAEAFSEWEN